AIDLNESVIVFEGDIWIHDLALKNIFEKSYSNNSIWFTRGEFTPEQYGGVLLKDNADKVLDIQIIPKYTEQFIDYFKLSGIMSIGVNELSIFKEKLNDYANKSIEQYYLVP